MQKNILFEDAYDNYKKFIDLKLKFQSIRKIKSRIENHVLPYFKGVNIYELKERNIIEWQYHINTENFTYSYKKSLFYALVNFLNFCVLFYELDKNVASKVGNFKNDGYKKRNIDFFTIEEFNKFIRCVDDEIYRQFFNLMFYTGTRPGEAMALKFSDLNDSHISINKTISKECVNGSRVVNSPKTSTSNRVIAIDFKLNLELLALKSLYQDIYMNYDYDYYVFGGLKPLSATTITRIKNKACEKAGVKQIRLHDFRHSHATLLVNNNLMINEISKRLGHSDISTTLNIYIHTDSEQEKKVINTLNSIRS